MFYYLPPKSNLHGHRLLKMPAAREKALFDQFLATAASEYKFMGATLSRGHFQVLTEEQCARCIDEITQDEAASGKAGLFMLQQIIGVSKWCIDGKDVATTSRFQLHYGQLPCIMTFLLFDTVEQFQYIKRVLEDIGLCKLNEKHLKQLKSTKGLPIEFTAGFSTAQIQMVAEKLSNS